MRERDLKLTPEEKGGTRGWKKASFLGLVVGSMLLLVALASWAAMKEAEAGDRAVSPELGKVPAGGALAQGAGSGRSYPAPDFTFTLFDGQEQTLSDLRGKAVVLNFWASWCPPCRAEARGMERVWQTYQEKGVVFLGVNIQDSEKNARAFLKEFGVTYPNGQDTTGEIAASYGITGIPETFFITKEGKVSRRWIGAIGESQLAAFIEQLLR